MRGVTVGHLRLQLRELVDVARSHPFRGRRHVDDTRLGVELGSSFEDRHEKLGEESRAHDIGSKLNLISVLGQAFGRHHDPRIVDEDVEPGLGASERLRGGFDTRERGKIKFEECNRANLRVGRLWLLDGGFGFVRRPGSEVDAGGAVLSQLPDSLET